MNELPESLTYTHTRGLAENQKFQSKWPLTKVPSLSTHVGPYVVTHSSTSHLQRRGTQIFASLLWAHSNISAVGWSFSILFIWIYITGPLLSAYMLVSIPLSHSCRLVLFSEVWYQTNILHTHTPKSCPFRARIKFVFFSFTLYHF